MNNKDFKTLQEAYTQIYIKESEEKSISKEDYKKILDIVGDQYGHHFHGRQPVGIDENGNYFVLGLDEEREEDNRWFWHLVKFFHRNENGELVADKWKSISEEEFKKLENFAVENPIEKEKKEKWEAEAPERARKEEEARKKAEEHAEWKSNLSAGDREYYGLPQTAADIRRHGLR